MPRRFLLALCALCAAVVLSSCGGSSAQVEPVLEPDEAAPPKKVRNAHEIARSIAGGQVDVLMYVDRVRKHPMGPKVASLNLWKSVLEGTDLDPMQDLDRAFVTAPSVHDGEALVAVGEHDEPEQRLRAALDVIIARSDPPGSWVKGSPFPAASVTIEKERRVIALVEPHLIVVVPEQHASAVHQFVGCAGLPDPEGSEAIVLTAVDPAHTIDGSSAVKIPPTIRHARGTITPADDDGVDLYAEGQSSSPSQAQADAEALTERIAKVTTVKIAVVKVRLFRPVEFRAEGDVVKADRHVTQAELDRIFMFVASALPQQ